MKANFLTLFFAASIVLLAACTSSKTEGAADSDSLATAQADSIDPKLVKTADITFKVKDASASGMKISALVSSMGGMVMHHKLESVIDNSHSLTLSSDSVKLIRSYSTQADMTVRIPTEEIENFMDSVSKLALFVDRRTMDIEDRTFEYLATELKAENREKIVNERLKNRSVKVKEMAKVLALKDEQSDQTVKILETNAAVNYSTISLNFYQNNTISKEMIANTDLSVYRVPFFTSLKNALTGGWNGFLSVLIAVVSLWPLILILVLAFFGIRYYQKMKEKKVYTGLGI